MDGDKEEALGASLGEEEAFKIGLKEAANANLALLPSWILNEL